MNKKTLATGVLTAVAVSSLLFTTSVSAFWPFDGLFGKGSVKAAVTNFRAPQPMPGKINIGNDVVMRNLATMVEACNEIAKNPIQITPQPRQPMQGSTNIDRVAVQKLAVTDAKASAELNSVMSLLKTKCSEIAILNERFGKIVVTTPCIPRPVCNGRDCPTFAKTDESKYCKPTEVQGDWPKQTPPAVTGAPINGRVKCFSVADGNGCPEKMACNKASGYCEPQTSGGIIETVKRSISGEKTGVQGMPQAR